MQMMIGLKGDLPQAAGVNVHHKMDMNAKYFNPILFCKKQVTFKDWTFCIEATSFYLLTLRPLNWARKRKKTKVKETTWTLKGGGEVWPWRSWHNTPIDHASWPLGRGGIPLVERLAHMPSNPGVWGSKPTRGPSTPCHMSYVRIWLNSKFQNQEVSFKETLTADVKIQIKHTSEYRTK